MARQPTSATAHPRAERDRTLAMLLAAGLAFYYLVPSPLLSLPGLLLLAVCAWRRPPLALSLLPLTFPFWYVPKRVAGAAVFPLSEIALAVCVAVILLQWASVTPLSAYPARLRRLRRVLLGRVGALLLAGAALLAVGVGIGVVIARQRPEALRAFRWEIAEPLIYFALLVLALRGSRYLRWLVGAFCGSAALMAALALLQLAALHVTFSPLASGNQLVPYAAPRATGIYYGSGNSLGALLERALPVLVALLVVPRAANPWTRLVAAFGIALLAAGLWASDSRGAALGATAGCLLVLLFALGRRWFSFAVLAALALAALWQRARLAQEFLAGHHGSGEVRALVWRAAWGMIRDHPIFGIGPDQFLYYYSSRYTDHPYWIPYENGHLTPALYEPNLAHPHNLPLEVWLSGGLLALGSFALILWDLARRFLRLCRLESISGWRATFALGAGGSLLAGLAHGLVDSAYFAPDLALDFWWAAALLVLLSKQSRYPS
jgi:putative inorganic carbon (hco3(-)) transporter